ncbi:hypothetical protein OH491_23845 [Termitidicoccus mucosus]|uniref:hypothetical protein n=1 Tax=Termitidicoccus mucosus TaxID=1184151 RepID=UPI0011AB82D3
MNDIGNECLVGLGNDIHEIEKTNSLALKCKRKRRWKADISLEEEKVTKNASFGSALPHSVPLKHTAVFSKVHSTTDHGAESGWHDPFNDPRSHPPIHGRYQVFSAFAKLTACTLACQIRGLSYMSVKFFRADYTVQILSILASSSPV